jgi:hypothetical protein
MGKLTKGNVDARVANARRLVGEAVRYLVPITRSQEPGKTRAEVARVVGRAASDDPGPDWADRGQRGGSDAGTSAARRALGRGEYGRGPTGGRDTGAGDRADGAVSRAGERSSNPIICISTWPDTDPRAAVPAAARGTTRVAIAIRRQLEPSG